MRRVVSLFLPAWSSDRLRRILGGDAPPAEAPLVLIGREGGRRVVLAADAAAQRAGLRAARPQYYSLGENMQRAVQSSHRFIKA
jgi:protein ImuB